MKKETLWPIVTFLTIFVWCLRPIQGFDIWFYIEYGRQVVEEFTIPWSESFLGTTDVYAFHRHANHAWISYAASFIAYRLGSVAGLVTLKSLLITATAAVTYLNCRLSGLSRPWASLLTVLGVWTVRSRFLLRSVLFSDLLLALLVYLLLRSEQHEDRALPLLPLGLLMMLWTNTHQGVLVGCFLLFLWVFTRRYSWSMRLKALAVAGIAVLIRPYGWWYPAFFLEHFGNSTAVENVLEWTPLANEVLLTHLGPLVLLGVLAFVRSASEKKAPLGNALIALVFVVLAVRSQRAVGELLPVVVPMIATYLARLKADRRVLGPAVVAIAILLYLHGDGWPGKRLARLDSKYPVGLVAALPQDHGQIFNSYEFGNFLVFQGKKPFVHGITALFQEALLLDFYAVLNGGKQSDELVERFQIQEFMLHTPTENDSTRGMIERLFASPDWHLWWWDDSGYLFRRAEGRDLKAIRPWVEGEPWTDKDQASAQLEMMLKERPSSLALFLRAKLHLDEGEKEVALELLNRALDIKPLSYQTLLLRGTVAFKVGQLELSEESLRGASNLATKSPVPHFNLALLYLNSNRSEEARSELEKALLLDPEFKAAEDLLKRF